MQKLSRSMAGSDATKRPVRSLSKRALIAALASFSLLSCDPKIPEKPQPPEVPSAKVADASVKRGPLAPMSKGAAKPMAEPAVGHADRKGPAAPGMAQAPIARPMGPGRTVAPRKPCGSFCDLASDYPDAAYILHTRVTQSRRKMKLSAEEGRLAASYLERDLPSMPRSRQLMLKMPKTTIELIRSVNERGVTKKDAEEMAAYLVGFLESMRLKGLATFDECISHMIGREWHQIDYRGEGMTWQGQRKMYNRKRPLELDWVKDIKKPIYLHRFFEIEHKMRYFRRLFAPAGRLPPSPKVE